MQMKQIFENWQKYLKEEKDTKYAAKVLIYDKNKGVLILKRAKNMHYAPNKWDLPGGHIKDKEKKLDGATRETKEETKEEIEAKHIGGERRGKEGRRE